MLLVAFDATGLLSALGAIGDGATAIGEGDAATTGEGGVTAAGEGGVMAAFVTCPEQLLKASEASTAGNAAQRKSFIGFDRVVLFKECPVVRETKQGGYEAMAKQLLAWADVRNHAAHGRFDQFTREQVGLMIQGIGHFLAQHLP